MHILPTLYGLSGASVVFKYDPNSDVFTGTKYYRVLRMVKRTPLDSL
ncbi:MAG: hypothetical protein NZM38_05530 [Cytophagales bacterium]|nr:hypothetical protein [Cytophagales bacterium]MDW8384215.1 hypothetical protein [Flammeovirgaceae bacterium]